MKLLQEITFTDDFGIERTGVIHRIKSNGTFGVIVNNVLFNVKKWNLNN